MTKKIAPVSLGKVVNPNETRLCLCTTLSPVLRISRLLGLFPITWTHENNRCTYKKSLFWVFYTLLVICLYIYQVGTSVDFLHLAKKKSLLILLNEITEAIYGVYILILTVANFTRHPQWIKALNELLPVLKHDLFCQSAMKVVVKVQYGLIATIIFVSMLEITVLLWLHYSEGFQTNFDVNIFINRGVLACFEKLIIKALKHVPVHPMKEINETNNESEFFGVIYYKLCKSEHHCTTKMDKLSPPDLVEHLRILHEEISLCIYKFNDCMNPQFLVHTGVELTVLIIHWYAVIAYMVYNFKSPFAKTIHVMNCSFVIQHTIGLFLFLKNAQHLKNMIEGLTIFLLEYSTRISTPEEHQQVRIFIEKLKKNRPFTASGVFTIDLGIAGPISANILTYVLVALQFELPEE
ncbi:uncharacterized protein LOC108907603 [Anoplophora glabripennis]|uniref:uncharacterized protein LOC108907603 n=1 Tax=Anoplophora glabripennis TaxID=217634 RepID=UPI00087356B4|nr:uncharacterized protein LOC108907603 [Anoplophora glabripennis]